MSGHAMQETEIKLRLPDATQGRHLLRRAGFRVARRKTFESNVVFDTAGGALRQAGALLRIRESGRRTLLTYKGPARAERYKSREELETDLAQGPVFAEILARLGFSPVFRYEKYRTEYTEPRQRGLALLDETPIGAFLELEGEPEWIDRAAARLGFTAADYLTASYARLYLEYRQAHPLSPADMVFDAPCACGDPGAILS